MLQRHDVLGQPSSIPGWQEALRSLPVPARELLAGGIAGGAAKTSVAPLERAKILFQTGKLHGTSLGPTLSNIYRTEGVWGLFRGNGASVLRIVPYAAVHFWCYEHYRRVLVSAGVLGSRDHYVPPVLDLLAGSLAGSTAVLVTYPLDLVRTRLAFLSEAGGPRGGTAAAAAATGAAAAAGGGGGALQPRPGPSFSAAVAAAARSSSSSRGAGARRPPPAPYRFGGPALALSSSSRAAGSGRGGASSAAVHLAAGLSLPAPGNGCTGRAAPGRGGARALHSLPRPHLPHLPRHQHTIRSVLGGTLRSEGVRGLYHGVGASLYGILPYAGLKFYVYQHLKQAYTAARPASLTRTGADGRPRLPVPVMLAFGAAAGLVAQTATYPFDVVRRQMQVEGLRLREASADAPTRQLAAAGRQLSLRSTPQALVLLARTHGWRCLYAGLSINYMKVVPSTAIGFTLYDFCKSALHLPNHL